MAFAVRQHFRKLTKMRLPSVFIFNCEIPARMSIFYLFTQTSINPQKISQQQMRARHGRRSCAQDQARQVLNRRRCFCRNMPKNEVGSCRMFCLLQIPKRSPFPKISPYYSVPNERTGPNKRTGWNFDQNTRVQGKNWQFYS